MSTSTKNAARPPAPTREELREQFRQHTDAVFDRLFPADGGPPPSFDQLETRTLQLTRDLAAWLLEQRARSSPGAEPAQPPGCPTCGRPGRRVTRPDAPLPRRTVVTRAGPVELAREKWRCTTCRVVFFPP
jgi:hypothetical protein